MNATHLTSSSDKFKMIGHLLAASVVHPVFVVSVAVGGVCLIGNAQVIVVATMLAAGLLFAVVANIAQFRKTPASPSQLTMAATTRFGPYTRPAGPTIHELRTRAAVRSHEEPLVVDQLPVIQQATPDRALPTADELEDFAATARAAGVTNVSLTVHKAMVSGAEHTSEGLVIDLVADLVTVVQRNAAGTSLGAYSESNELISFVVPRELIAADVEGFMFSATMEDWNERGATVDIEWHMTMDGDVIYAIGHLDGNKITVGTPALVV